jgi:hypothetical protein
LTRPIYLSDEAMNAVLAAAHPLQPDARGPFLEACARALAGLPEVGDGIVWSCKCSGNFSTRPKTALQILISAIERHA